MLLLKEFVSWLVHDILSIKGRFGDSLHFFIYDTVKILLLIFVFIAFIGFLRSYISEERIRRLMSLKYGIGNLFAALFGAITPFCSCSSIPIFLSFIKARIPLGVSLSFLITSPLVNEYLVALMLGFFGLKVTLVYVVAGILIGLFSGIILGRIGLERYIEPDMRKEVKEKDFDTLLSRLKFGLGEAVDIIKKIWLWIIVGVGIGATLHNYVPQEFFQSVTDSTGIFSVPLAVILGVPLYANCAAIVPVAVVLFEKGIPLGTTLAFMMASSALSFPEAIILRRAMKLKLILIFFGTVALGIMFVGYLINILGTFLS